jgi:hypothetical protein
MLTFVLMAATLIAVYCFWIRPVLRSRPAFRELYDKEESFFRALREKLKGIKQKLSSAFVVAVSAAVAAYDFLAPAISGVDVSLLAAHVPPWAWPLILISITALLQFLRNLSDKRHEAELAEVSGSSREG